MVSTLSAIPSTPLYVPEIRDIHQRMRKPHFRAVDDAIARALEHSQERCQVRIQDELVQAGLNGSCQLLRFACGCMRETHYKRIHGAGGPRMEV